MSHLPARPEILRRIAGELHDVLIVGGGIVGAGIARDAAMRGLRTALVEQHDFASGTSSRSSRMLHGGLRYLEQGRIGLVHQASVEKKILARIAPHLARPLPFVFPAYAGTGRPLWQLRAGIKLYDWLGGRNFEPSRAYSRDETLHLVPALNPTRLAGSVQFFDALTNDARLVLDTLVSAGRHGAAAANYVRLIDARRDGPNWICELEDCETGATLTARARVIVNATGPWAAQLSHSHVRLRLTKGIHLVVEQPRLPISAPVIITADRRVLFVLPWGHRVIIGTTDTDYRGAPEDVAVSPADTEYVLRAANEYFPAVGLSVRDVVSSWAGVRPLLAGRGGASDISRHHQIRQSEPGWWDVAGGKLTTYRLMAEQTVNQIGRHLRVERPCRTATTPLINPADASMSGIEPPACTASTVAHYVNCEGALHLDDVMIRRSNWHHYVPDPGQTAVTIATWMGAALGWSPVQRQAELEAYQRSIPVRATESAVTT
jgi:glycerol-3-phosphate dehydrogenase